MKLKEKKTLGYAIFSILMIVLLSMYLGKADYDKINEVNKQGLHDAKDNSIKIAKKLKAYIYQAVENAPSLSDAIESNKIKTTSQVGKIKKITFGQVKSVKVKSKSLNKTSDIMPDEENNGDRNDSTLDKNLKINQRNDIEKGVTL